MPGKTFPLLAPLENTSPLPKSVENTFPLSRSSVAILTLDCFRSSSGIKETRAAGLPAQLTTGFPAAANYLPRSANLPSGGQYSVRGGNDSSYKEWIS